MNQKVCRGNTPRNAQKEKDLTKRVKSIIIMTKEHRRRLLPLISRNNRLAFWGQAVISFFALFLVDADEQRYKRNDDHSESE